MKIIKVYEHSNCGFCKQALKFLANNRYAVDRIDLFKTPPTVAEIKRMIQIQGGDFKRLFNTIGTYFQQSGLDQKLTDMSEGQAIKLLTSDGRLVKRPFVIWDEGGLVGFHEPTWKKVLGKEKE